jgi:hypothetical protein
MIITPPRRLGALVPLGAATLLGVAALTGVPAAVAATPTVTIQDPGTPTAGPVTLRGTASGGTSTTTVLFAVDVSQSTAHPSELDCDGNGNFGPKDNFNGDDTTGDVLDCEISAVQALNAGLAASAGSSLVSLEHFATSAAADDLDPQPGAPVWFDSPANNGTGTEPRLVTAARTLQRATGPSGTTLDEAVALALRTLGGAPAGPKWIMFLSDGQVSDAPTAATVSALKASGVHLRSFAIDDAQDIGCQDGLGDIARATGESCLSVHDPAQLASAVSTTQPDGVTAVRVTIGGQTLAATLDVAGGWSLPLLLGAGTYPTHVVATLSSGKTVSADRTFSVAAPAPGTPNPPAPGTVTALSPTAVISASEVSAKQPKPLKQRLPRTVTGRVGRPSAAGPAADGALEGATVLLQGRGKAGTDWVSVGSTKVAQGGYAVSWKPKAEVKQLRVLLLPYKNFSEASAAVLPAGISDCHRSGRSSAWTFTCRTTAANGKHAMLTKNGKVVDRSVVRRHHVSVSGSGRLAQYTLVVKSGPGERFKLKL